MAQDKDKLEKLLQVIDKLANEAGNEWFKEKLAERYSQVRGNVQSEFDKEILEKLNEKVVTIHDYLQLEVFPMIDYSLISDSATQNQLYVDCLEMGKYRLGKYEYKPDFLEFCRYGHLQAEELINYFYIKKFNGDIKRMGDFVPQEFRDFEHEKHESISSIPYKIKLRAFKNSNGIPYNIDNVIYKINIVRNEISHRNSTKEIDEEEILKKYRNAKLEYVDYKTRKLIDDENKIKKAGDLIIFKRKEDWDSVYNAIGYLKKLIIKSLE